MPKPITDPMELESIDAAYAYQVFLAARIRRLRLAGLLPLPPFSLPAHRLLRQLQLRGPLRLLSHRYPLEEQEPAREQPRAA